MEWPQQSNTWQNRPIYNSHWQQQRPQQQQPQQWVQQQWTQQQHN